MTHQLVDTDHIDADFDSARSIGVPKILEPEKWLRSTISQRPLMRGLELRHWPTLALSIAHPARKETVAFGFRQPTLKNGETAREVMGTSRMALSDFPSLT